mmetsp:Transcript_6198/g.7276  ORF Transcript_6198/g.7276 Transcript_6198/m.7276 type:complete len:257 (-) Transcript_6198:494-1264(-)
MPVALFFEFFDFAGISYLLFQLVHFSLLSFDLSFELCQELILFFDSLCVDFQNDGEACEPFFKFHFVAQQIIIIVLFCAELVLDVLICCLDHLIIGKQFFDLSRFFTIEFVLEALVSDLFLCLVLSLELLVLAVGEFLLFEQLIALVVQLLRHLRQHLHLDVQELDLNLGFLDLLSELSCLFQSVLIISLGQEVIFDLCKVVLKTCLLFRHASLQISDELDLCIVAVLGLLIECLFLILMQFVLQVGLLIFVNIVA